MRSTMRGANIWLSRRGFATNASCPRPGATSTAQRSRAGLACLPPGQGGRALSFSGGGFFVGYWLTTGKDNGETSSFSNAIFVGGWYTTTIKFSMRSGTSGVYISCPTS